MRRGTRRIVGTHQRKKRARQIMKSTSCPLFRKKRAHQVMKSTSCPLFRTYWQFYNVSMLTHGHSRVLDFFFNVKKIFRWTWTHVIREFCPSTVSQYLSLSGFHLSPSICLLWYLFFIILNCCWLYNKVHLFPVSITTQVYTLIFVSCSQITQMHRITDSLLGVQCIAIS